MWQGFKSLSLEDESYQEPDKIEPADVRKDLYPDKQEVQKHQKRGLTFGNVPSLCKASTLLENMDSWNIHPRKKLLSIISQMTNSQCRGRAWAVEEGMSWRQMMKPCLAGAGSRPAGCSDPLVFCL